LFAAAAIAALQEEMKALVASIPDGAGAAFTAMQLQELEQQSRVYQYMAARVPVPTHLVFPIWKSVTGASSEGAQKYPTCMPSNLSHHLCALVKILNFWTSPKYSWLN
jgi:hypothetical protein